MPAKRLDPVSLRLPADLREQLDVAAQEGGRSLNAEIRFRLEKSFEVGEDAAGHDATKRIDTLETELETLRAELRQHASRLKAIEAAKNS